MKHFLVYSLASFLASIFLFSCSTQQLDSSNYSYGLTFSQTNIVAKVWAPKADKVSIRIYENCDSQSFLEELQLLKSKNTDDWALVLEKTYLNKIYTFSIIRGDSVFPEVVDPYVKAVCANGKRGSIENVAEINPENWSDDKRMERASDEPIILYELHVKDYSIDEASQFENPGKYVAFLEDKKGLGIDHIKSLGATHIHLLPVFDFASIDETSANPNYNWGYDPQNYFVPEGSYSTKPQIPVQRILEFKQMVKAIHNKGLGVIMDVVYNHTYYLDNSSYQVWAPGEYYRQWDDGKYSNASGCGNELATEQENVREMIIESLEYWMNEYHIDGFRFDLMGIMDINTMREIEARLKSIDEKVVLYGEGWLAGDSPLTDSLRSTKANISKFEEIAAFSDEIRDGIKGHWSDEKDKGFVSGKKGLKNSVKFGIAAGIKHNQIDYAQVNNSNFAWAKYPSQCINYVSCHDNHTLWDKLEISAGEYEPAVRKKMHLLAQSIVLCSQGTAFLHAGTEFFRTKFGDHNSFESPDSINAIRWGEIQSNVESIDYLKSLIAFKKSSPLLNLPTQESINETLLFLDKEDDPFIMYTLSSDDETLLFIFSPVEFDGSINLPEGNWSTLYKDFQTQKTGSLSTDTLKTSGPNAIILQKLN